MLCSLVRGVAVVVWCAAPQGASLGPLVVVLCTRRGGGAVVV